MKKIISHTAFIIAVIAFVTACGNNYKHIEQDEVMKMVEKNPDAIILDVRTLEEYNKKHIPNAVLLPIDDLRAGDFSKIPDKNKIILIYCWTGRRAEDSAKILIDNGYKKVYEFGGLVTWTGAVEGSEVK